MGRGGLVYRCFVVGFGFDFGRTAAAAAIFVRSSARNVVSFWERTARGSRQRGRVGGAEVSDE